MFWTKVRVSLFHKEQPKDDYEIYLGMQNLTFDMCKYIAGEVKYELLDLVADKVKEHGNWMDPCPRRGSVYLKDFVSAPTNALEILSLGEYMAEAYLYTIIDNKETYLSDQKLLFEIVQID